MVGGTVSRGRTLKASLLLLVACCTVPIALAAATLVFFFISEEYDRAEQELKDRASLMLGAIHLRTQNIVESLEVLAGSPAVRARDLATFREHMVRANGIYQAFGTVLVERSGQIVISTRRAVGEPLPIRTVLDTQEKVFETGRPHISGVVASTASDAPIISMEVPVTIQGRTEYVLAAGISPQYIADVIKTHVPDGWIGVIVDSRGLVISRVPDLQLVGQPVSPHFQQYVGRTSEGWIKTTSREGTPIFNVAVASNELGWTAFISIPQEFVGKDIRWDAGALASFVVLALILSLLLARRLSREIVGTLSAFEYNVAALSENRELHPIPTGWAELNHMHRALLGVKSDLEASKKRADEERSLLKETVQSMPIGVVILDPQGNVLVVNAKASELWGTDQLQHFDDFKRITRRRLDGSAYPADHWPIMRALYKGALVQNEEVIHVQPDGSERRLCINAAPVRNSSGSTIASVAAFYDTTDLHAALDQHKLLLEEINHRVNNTMATIQAIATLTRPGVSSVGEYVTAFQKRLMALAHAYRLLTDNNWQGADLCEISKGILAPYGNEQVDFDGPRVQLAAVHTLAIAAALQELATNAAKYGSLSVPSGRLNLRWRVENDQLHLHWQESGGPVVVEPTRRGFGSRFIQETLKKQVDWDVEVEYASEGLKFNLSLKLDLPAVQKASAA